MIEQLLLWEEEITEDSKTKIDQEFKNPIGCVVHQKINHWEKGRNQLISPSSN